LTADNIVDIVAMTTFTGYGVHSQRMLGKAQIPLRRLCDKVRNKFPTKSRTQIMNVANFMICVSNKVRRHKSWKSADFVADTNHESRERVADTNHESPRTLSPTMKSWKSATKNRFCGNSQHHVLVSSAFRLILVIKIKYE